MCRANNAAEISAQEYVLGSHLALPKPEQPYPEPQSRAENERHFNDGWSSETCHSIGFQREDPYIRWHERATNTAGESGVCLQGSTAPGSLKRNGAISSFNLVDLEKIRRGVDVRTTVMLRNIPNRVDQRMLKQFLDGTSFGKYDFLYLRIDFTNNSNVGYGFVNFADPASIIEFVERRVGNSWGLFGSTKRVEVSYAAVQGQDCLIQKFRNSSVMLEHPSFRPLIFYPKSSHLQGQPQPFPEPDNDSKMRRSVANAGQIGLFSPRHQKDGLRDQVRSRRSQFDRGTRMASLEEGKLSSPGGLSSDLSFLSPVSSHRSSLTSNNSPVTPSRPRSTNPYEYFDSSYSQFLPARASLLLNPVLRTASTSAGIPAYRENLAAKFGASSSEHIISDGISIGPSLYSSRTGNNAFDPFVIHQSDNTRY